MQDGNCGRNADGSQGPLPHRWELGSAPADRRIRVPYGFLGADRLSPQCVWTVHYVVSPTAFARFLVSPQMRRNTPTMTSRWTTPITILKPSQPSAQRTSRTTPSHATACTKTSEARV